MANKKKKREENKLATKSTAQAVQAQGPVPKNLGAAIPRWVARAYEQFHARDSEIRAAYADDLDDE